MNKRLIVALGLFSSLFIYLFLSWDEYMYTQEEKERRGFSK